MLQRRVMPSHEIMERYRKGERDFSDIMCSGAEFGGATLVDAIFRNADLSFSSFDTADLTDADFSSAFLDWSSFRKSILRRTKFDGASIKWCALNEAIVDKTSFRKADLSWSIMFSTNRNAADWTGANFVLCAFDPSEITSKGIAQHPDQLERLKGRIPYELWLRIKFSLSTVTMQFERQSGMDVGRTAYERAMARAGYGIAVQAPATSTHVYSPEINVSYQSSGTYQTERKKVPWWMK